MEQQISELSDQIYRLQDEGNQLDQELEENQSEKNVKYRDLRKREEAMDQVSKKFNLKNSSDPFQTPFGPLLDPLTKYFFYIFHFQFLQTFEESKRQEFERCADLQRKVRKQITF